ncbi:MAG: type II secretion system protein GspN [Bdellovibrionaceae bacterium]|nr:type II secretion system protein GspN [Pseudobdellovibrionaceae bacterium]
MDSIKTIVLKTLRQLLSFNTLSKALLILIFSVIFIFVLFPTKDLSDVVSQNVSKFTQNQFYLEFDNIEFNLLSELGVKLDNVYLETPRTAPLNIRELIALPAISTFLYKKPQGKLHLKGIFKGDIEVNITKHREDSSSESKVERSEISVEANKLDLKELKNFLSLPVSLKGRLNLSTKVITPLLTNDTPEGVNTNSTPAATEIQDLTLTIKNFELPQTTLDQNGSIPIDIPGIKLSELVIKARYFGNKLVLSEIKLGKDSDELLGTIKGDMNFSPMIGMGMPMLNQYELSLDLKMKKSFYDKIYLTLSILNAGSYFSPISGGYQFKSKLKGAGTYSVPRFDAYR